MRPISAAWDAADAIGPRAEDSEGPRETRHAQLHEVIGYGSGWVQQFCRPRSAQVPSVIRTATGLTLMGTYSRASIRKRTCQDSGNAPVFDSARSCL